MMIKKVLLFNPPSSFSIYKRSSIKASVPILPSMSLAMVAGSLVAEGVDVRIVDLALLNSSQVKDCIRRETSQFKPDMAGTTATTPLFYEASMISDEVKGVSKEITTILGGPHASSLPIESLNKSSFDIVVVGEGEEAVKHIARGAEAGTIQGVYVKDEKNGNSCDTSCPKSREIPIDELPFPALHLFDSKRYACPLVIARNNPVGPIEMSRGCVFNCSFCNKTVHGRKFKVKSPGRIIDELRILKKLGYREFHVLDDQLTTDIDKAKAICEEIIRNEINMTWNLRTGVRVDTIDREFLDLAKRAGCYQVGIGFESGSQEQLDAVGKGIKLEQALNAARMIRRSGIEMVGFFMLGLPGESVSSMDETIRFAIRLNPDFAKATILVPFPGTRIYDEFEQKGLIKTRDWSRYNFHNAYNIYNHPTLDWDTMKRYYDLFHRRFYFRMGYLARRLWKSLLQGRVFVDLYYAYQTFFEK
ncbi:MAG: radical SAM protein [Candidatus Omnitrophota bacterium]